MKSQKLLESFTAYCKANPDLRFWQALRNWCGWGFIFVCNQPPEYWMGENATSNLVDTFYWEKNQTP